MRVLTMKDVDFLFTDMEMVQAKIAGKSARRPQIVLRAGKRLPTTSMNYIFINLQSFVLVSTSINLYG